MNIDLILLAKVTVAIDDIVTRHRPDPDRIVRHTDPRPDTPQCAYCSDLAGRWIPWPCPDRAAIGALLPDPSNRLLPPIPGDQGDVSASRVAAGVPPDSGG